MANRPYSNEEREKIETLYKNGTKIEDIAAELGRDASGIYYYLTRNGLRSPSYSRKKGAKKTCPKCRATDHKAGARFCWRCGTDIRNEEAILSERISRILRDIQLMPESARNEASDTLQDILKYLEKKGV